MARKKAEGEATHHELDDDTIDHWLTYHPPDEHTKPHHDAVTEACLALGRLFDDVLVEVPAPDPNAPPPAPGPLGQAGDGQPGPLTHLPESPAVTFDDVRMAVHHTINVADEHCPSGSDKSAALEYLRLARHAANERILAHAGTGNASRWDRLFADLATFARWKANSAIALAPR